MKEQQTGEQVRRWLWYSLWVAGGLWLARSTLLPAPVRGARLTELTGSRPYYAGLSWHYGLGARPASIIFDLSLRGSGGSVTTDGEALEAEIPLGTLPRGPYRLTVSATYRLLGVTRTIITRTEGVV